MKTEELRALGLDDDQMREVFKLNSLAIENVRSQYSDLETTKMALETQLEELKGSGVSKDDYESLVSDRENLALELEKLKDAHEKEMNNLHFNNALDITLKELGAKSLKATKAILNIDSIEFKEGKLEGIEEEVNRVKSEYSYLFFDKNNEAADEPRFSTPGKSKRNSESDPFAKKKAKYR